MLYTKYGFEILGDKKRGPKSPFRLLSLNYFFAGAGAGA
ncbi:MAG: hypothetical protein H6Q54_580, partial [Deltaproteobacteria bacterium]|nr:hypothetical protein [Deltaproteobacteria bacterium]